MFGSDSFTFQLAQKGKRKEKRTLDTCSGSPDPTRLLISYEPGECLGPQLMGLLSRDWAYIKLSLQILFHL